MIFWLLFYQEKSRFNNALSVINEENIKQLLDLLNTSAKDVKKPYLAPFSTEVYQFLKTRIADKVNTNTKSLKEAYDYLINSPDIKQYADLISKYFIVIALGKDDKNLAGKILEKHPTLAVNRFLSQDRFWSDRGLYFVLCQRHHGDSMSWLRKHIYKNLKNLDGLSGNYADTRSFQVYSAPPFEGPSCAVILGNTDVLRNVIYPNGDNYDARIGFSSFVQRIKCNPKLPAPNPYSPANLLTLGLMTWSKYTNHDGRQIMHHFLLDVLLTDMNGKRVPGSDAIEHIVQNGFSQTIAYLLNNDVLDFKTLFTTFRELPLPEGTKILDREQALNDLIEALESYNPKELRNRGSAIDLIRNELVTALNIAKQHNNTRLYNALDRLFHKTVTGNNNQATY